MEDTFTPILAAIKNDKVITSLNRDQSEIRLAEWLNNLESVLISYRLDFMRLCVNSRTDHINEVPVELTNWLIDNANAFGELVIKKTSDVRVVLQYVYYQSGNTITGEIIITEKKDI